MRSFVLRSRTYILKKNSKMVSFGPRSPATASRRFPAVNVALTEPRAFVSDSWEKNWIYSKHPGKEFGKFVRTAGKFFHDEEEDKGEHFLRFLNV